MPLGSPLLAGGVHDKDDGGLDAVLVVGVGVADGGVAGDAAATTIGEKVPFLLD